MEDFYTYGDAAPVGRLNWIYQNYIPGVTKDEEDETTAPESSAQDTESVVETEVATEESTGTQTEAETDSDKTQGCKSAAAGTVFVLVGTLTATAIIGKKKKNNG